MKVFGPSQLKELDQYTILSESISSIQLMERASVSFVDAISKEWDTTTPIVVFAGPGNNGGDALAVARLLLGRNYKVRVYLFDPNNRLSADCAENRFLLSEVIDGNHFMTVGKMEFVPPKLTSDTLVIDGLFGTGLTRRLEGGFAGVVKYINASPAKVVSIDIPSGLMCEDNSENDLDCIIQAYRTFTFHAPKLAFFLSENERFLGRWDVINIGLSREGIRIMESDYNYLQRNNLMPLVKPISRFTHKGMQGHALLIGGSQGMAGAAILSAKAALRSGVGKITVHTPEACMLPLQVAVPEAVLDVDSSSTHFSQIVETNAFNAVAIGPGLGITKEIGEQFQSQLVGITQPLVLDADALNLIAQQPSLLKKLPPLTILTPHPKELERIIGTSENSFERLQIARELARTFHLIVVIKGANTAIVSFDGTIYFNSTGNPGMASAGMGDALTGVIVSLLAQGYEPLDAARLGVYIHGLAGDMAALEKGSLALMASDLIEYLGLAWRELQAN